MKYNQLNISASKKTNRVGRGIAAGQGKTAGRGTKGQKSRTGSSRKPGFAGGTNPLMQQLPKLPGFRSSRTAAENVHTDQMNNLKASKIDANVLADAGLISNAFVQVKLLSRGEVTRKIDVALPFASESAIAALQAAGGSFEKTARLSRPKTSTKVSKK
jgi:large subunit ribosomal protein L15